MGAQEPVPLRRGHLCPVHPVTGSQPDRVHGPLVLVTILRPHPEVAWRHPDHLGRVRRVDPRASGRNALRLRGPLRCPRQRQEQSGDRYHAGESRYNATHRYLLQFHARTRRSPRPNRISPPTVRAARRAIRSDTPNTVSVTIIVVKWNRSVLPCCGISDQKWSIIGCTR